MVGPVLACLSCKTVICVTPEGNYENAFQPTAFLDAMRGARRPAAEEDPFDLGMNTEPPNPRRR